MQQRQQEAKQQKQAQGRLFRRRRELIASLIVFTLLVSMALLILYALNIIKNVAWVIAIVPSLFTLCGVIIGILQWLDPVSSSRSPSGDAVDTNGTRHGTELVSLSTAHIFHFDEPNLPNPGEFYARQDKRIDLIHRTSQRASTAITGDYRIGKSWLMQYLQQVAPTHSQLGPHVRVGRFSATHPECRTLPGFVRKSLEVLSVSDHNAHRTKLTLEQLSSAIREMKNLGIIPVLCIDEFAGLIGLPGFDKSFVNGLRAIASDDGLVLITASKQPLHDVIEKITGGTSPLHNIMPQLTLRPFTEAEARLFVREKSQQAGFSAQEQAFFLECAAIHRTDGTKGWPPMRLQQVGKMLLEDKRRAADERQKYNVQDSLYQKDFKSRLDEQYETVVKSP